MIEVNQYYVLNQTVVFQQFYNLLASDDQGVLFHCSDVKDRTGFAALLLTALGVSSEQFMQDYFLTSRYFIPEQVYRWFSERFGLNVPLNTIPPLLEVRAAYLNGAFELINKQYGSIDKYLSQALGVTTAMRRTLQLQY
ncbi:tyrosine-protein phosphatase [Paraglaciecola agarilytica]|uniref:tyrosine-protein phosphatase n=1 Tax=Paraglaciecola chathamensis TaxID=368405 RepID=UPI0023559C80|nr:tyrosine-protein phosphatase [Paraglaciecola agarilytica]|tara:strand:- start:6670 stop:7086 length:417 start_codon:yes stop_codon:yes gene_type:complete